MLNHIHLAHIGPTGQDGWAVPLAPRLNVLTGENGLGKTLILEAVWALLTGDPSRIDTYGVSDDQYVHLKGSYAHITPPNKGQSGELFLVRKPVRGWFSDGTDLPSRVVGRKAFRPHGVVIFARADGGIAVWDDLLASPTPPDRRAPDDAVHLSRDEVFTGKRTGANGHERVVCPGLIDDWVRWQDARAPAFDALCRVLATLSPPDHPLVPGEPTRVDPTNRRDIPTLKLTYGEVPVTLAPAGMRRILSLAYALVWAWTEHTKAARRAGVDPTREVIVLIDEPDAHLHPAWQRHILPAALQAIAGLAPEVEVQLLVATHAPLVLASVEPWFDEARDNLIHLEADGRIVRPDNPPFAQQGDAALWLVSEAFGLASARSIEAEWSIDAAMALMRHETAAAEEALAALEARERALAPLGYPPPPTGTLVERIDHRLRRYVASHDPFWFRWLIPESAS